MRSILIFAGTVGGLAAALAGCAPASPQFDRAFGETVPALRAQQTLNPDAPLANQNKSVDGVDGRAAREAMNRYYKSFAEPPAQTNVFNIGVGTGTATESTGDR